jgi:adenine-specific DNA-methyltransferase
MENRFKNKFYKILQKDARLWDKGKKGLNETLLKDLIDKLDEKIIELLLGDKELKENFFIKIKDAFVLRQNELKFFIDENKLDNSYTQYQNKIGLRVGNKLLSERDEVFLDWPFKDCVLEGGMTKEDQKRKEIFFNEVLAKDEIDRLFDPKALVNWKRYGCAGIKNAGVQNLEPLRVGKIKRDKDGVIRENLIIKGNNLLALHSLKEQFSGKVKLIYIDPPYNTGGDANIFTYNNNFNHSSWLTFMKNRLEVAKGLLREDGFITIAIDYCELFYLGALLDEIFERENRLGIISIIHKPEGRFQEKFFSTSNEFMLVYCKNKLKAEFNQVALDEENKARFNRNDSKGKFLLKNYLSAVGGEQDLKINKPKFFYPIYVSKDLKEITLEEKTNYEKILPITRSGVERSWITIPSSFLERLKNGEILAERNEKNSVQIYYKFREQQVLKTHWIGKRYNATGSGSRLLTGLIGETEFSYPKSLYVVLDTIKIMTKRDDIILDFFAGSGTTGHATLELNKDDGGSRQFILIEQLDEHKDIIKKRVKKVIQNNKAGDFIYLELAKWNEEAKEKILKAKSLGELEKLFGELYERYFLNYNVEIKKFQESLKEEEFRKLSLSEQKKLFVEMLDMNQMYVNFSERADKKYKLSKEDIRLSEEFYNSKEK